MSTGEADAAPPGDLNTKDFFFQEKCMKRKETRFFRFLRKDVEFLTQLIVAQPCSTVHLTVTCELRLAVKSELCELQ